MYITTYFSLQQLLGSFLATVCVLVVLYRTHSIVGVFDPLIIMHAQVIFTAILLGLSGILPKSQLFYIGILYLFWMTIWKIKKNENEKEIANWIYCIYLLVIISAFLNVYLILTKGFILFGDDVGAAKVEFYQNFGIYKRVNQLVVALVPIYIFREWVSKSRWGIKETMLFVYSIYCVLTLGSKAGISALFFEYGIVIYFYQHKIRLRTILLMAVGMTISMLAMFYLIYGSSFLVNLAFRLTAMADGPFYYYSGHLNIHRSLAYPFYMFFNALRILSSLPESSLGPEINYQYFSFDNDLYGPNPQIFVESQVIFGNFAILSFLAFIGIAFLISRMTSNPFSLGVWILFLRSYLIDSQLAFSYLIDIVIVGGFFICGILVRRILEMNMSKRWAPNFE